ncbi:MAG: FAD-binding oxidoreductase, partial [Terriglobales bacterium]
MTAQAAASPKRKAGVAQPTKSSLSWGRYPSAAHAHVYKPAWNDQVPAILEAASSASLLPHGLGRSYGDSCLNADRSLVDCRRLNRILGFDESSGVLRCESGVTFADIIRLFLPEGWFLPVTPGTQFVTVGGAIANDVHGKNHHCAGTFGAHVRQFGLH